MIILSFIIGLIIGGIVGAKLYSTELKNLEKRKNELAVMYYKHIDSLTSKLEKLENELREYKK